MKIKPDPDQEIVNTIREGLKRTGGYCPCRRERTEATKYMCQEIKDQIADPDFEGYCHCMLYYRSLEDQGRNAMLSKKLAAIAQTRCVACGVCENTCPLGAVKVRRGCYAASWWSGSRPPGGRSDLTLHIIQQSPYQLN